MSNAIGEVVLHQITDEDKFIARSLMEQIEDHFSAKKVTPEQKEHLNYSHEMLRLTCKPMGQKSMAKLHEILGN